MANPTIIVLIGVAGSGKTTIGQLLSRRLQWPFFDADDFHPPANIAKMSAGIPLEDDDRWPWLEQLRAKIRDETAAGHSAIFACSALRKSYRDFLTAEDESVKLVYLKGAGPLLSRRIASRRDHFMQEGMLESQLAALEEPDDCLTVEISASPDAIATAIIHALVEEHP